LLQIDIDDRRPILVTCHTNHALDQFLESILEYTDNLVRLGGRSKNKSLDKYLLKNVKYNYK